MGGGVEGEHERGKKDVKEGEVYLDGRLPSIPPEVQVCEYEQLPNSPFMSVELS